MLSTMPQTELETGQFERADELMRQFSGALSETPRHPKFSHMAAVSVAGVFSWLKGDLNDPPFPSRLADIATSSPFGIPIFVATTYAGLAFDALTRGKKETCQRAYDALAWLSGHNISFITADRLLGQLALEVGEVQKAIDHFEAALAFCEEAGYRPDYAWTCWGFAAALLERKDNGDRRRAEELLAEAHQIAIDLGMPPLLQRVEDLMSNMGEPKAPVYPDGLTQREVEVLRLVSAGRTDREIAEELIIGIRTVNTHVGNILNKTGAANRAEAVNYANQHGLATPVSEGED